MRSLIDLVGDLGAERSRGIIYAIKPWTAESRAVVHDPWSVLGPPDGLEPFLDADLAHEYLRAWSSWQSTRPSPEAAVEALVAFAARPLAEAKRDVPRLSILRATTASGRIYNDPTDDVIYQLMLELESQEERFIIVERLADPSGETYVQVLRQADGTYVVEQRDGSAATHRSLTDAKMPAALLRLSDWAFRGRDITERSSHASTS